MNEKEIYQRIQDGDETAITELVEANLEDLWPIARSLAKEGGKWTPEDLYQEGALAMIRFAQRWVYQEGIPFTAAARQRVRGAMRDFLRRRADTMRGGEGQPLSLDASGGDETGRTLGETLADKEGEKVEPNATLPDNLSEKEATVLNMRVFAEFPESLQAVANHLNITPQQVQTIQRRAMRKMQKVA